MFFQTTKTGAKNLTAPRSNSTSNLFSATIKTVFHRLRILHNSADSKSPELQLNSVMGEEEERKMGKRIVVAVDESKESMTALSWCLSNLIARDNPDNTVLVLLYVKPPPPVYSYFDAAGFLFSSDAVAAVENYGTELVRSVMDRAEAVYKNFSTRINVERVVGRGDPRDVICHTVKRLNADTLVMGSHGYGFIMRALLGSVSDHCAKNVKCPVVIVKHKGDPTVTSSCLSPTN